MSITTNSCSIAQPIYTALLALRIVFAFVALGLYTPSLVTAARRHSEASSDSVYAEVVIVLSILDITGQVYVILTQRRLRRLWLWCIVDGILLVLWVALFGRFASELLGGAGDGDERLIGDMAKETAIAATWTDLVNALLCVLSFVVGIVICCSGQRKCQERDPAKVDVEQHMCDALLEGEDERYKMKASLLGPDTEEDMVSALKMGAPISRLPSYASVIRAEETVIRKEI